MSNEHREVKLVPNRRSLSRQDLRKFGPGYTHLVVAFDLNDKMIPHWLDEAIRFDVYDIVQANPPYAPEVGDVVQIVSEDDRYSNRIGTVVNFNDRYVQVNVGTNTCSFFYKDLMKIGERTDKKGDRG